MSARRKEMHDLQELVRLHRMGVGCRKVASLLGLSPNTERRYRRALMDAGLLEGDAGALPELSALRDAVESAIPVVVGSQEVSTAMPWRDTINAMRLKGAGPKAIFDTLVREKPDFTASRWAVKRLWRRLKSAEGVDASSVAIRVETAPGAEAQVDFGYVGMLYDAERGLMRKAWVFVMTLSYSRHQFCRVAFDQSASTWLRLHAEAFESFGGTPAVVRPDNLKAAVIRAAFGADSTPALNRSYRELARHYGFKVDPTPPYQPQKKGKVERSVRYVKRNFFQPLVGDFSDIDDANERLAAWVTDTAGVRTHGTTGRQPLVEFSDSEQQTLLPLPNTPYQLVIWKKAKVHNDSHFLFERRTYPVPWRFIGKEVWARALPRSIEVYVDDQRVITHARGVAAPDAILDRCLPKERADYRHRGRQFWEERADAIASDVGTYIRDVFDSDDALSMLRQVQSIVTLLERHPVERALAACKRASFYGSHDYRTLRDILRNGLDFEPLPVAMAPVHGHLTTPRYARTTAELLQLPLESFDEHH